MPTNPLRFRLSPLLAVVGVWVFCQAAPAEERVEIIGMQVRPAGGRAVLEIDHRGTFALAPTFERVDDGYNWRVTLPKTVLKAPVSTLYSSRAKVTTLAQGVTLEVTSPSPPVPLSPKNQKTGRLSFDLGPLPEVVVKDISLKTEGEELFLEIAYQGDMKTPPKTFTLKNPERWVLDLSGELGPEQRTTLTEQETGILRLGQPRPGIVRIVANGPYSFTPRSQSNGRLVYAARLPASAPQGQRVAPALPSRSAQVPVRTQATGSTPKIAALPPLVPPVAAPEQATRLATASGNIARRGDLEAISFESGALLAPPPAPVNPTRSVLDGAVLPAAKPALAAPEPVLGNPAPRRLIARRLDLDPVNFPTSLLLSDQPEVSLDAIEAVVSQPVETLPYYPSPLETGVTRTQGLESAAVLKPGEFFQTQAFRVFGVGGGQNDDIFQNTSNSYTYGFLDGVELRLDLQGQDNNSPGLLGNTVNERFVRDLGVTSNSFQEITLQGKFRLVNEPTFKSSVVFSGTVGNRAFSFTPLQNPIEGRFERTYGQTLIPALEVPLTWQLDARTTVTLNPKLVFLPGDNAGFIPINPQLGGSFGTVGAVGLGASYSLSEHLQLRADVTPILFGNNSVNTATGLPNKTLVYNAGFRYVVNPRLALDVFASNSYGNTGVGSVVAREDVGFGASLTFIPDKFFFFDLAANHKFDKSFDLSETSDQRKAFVRGGFTFLDGGTVPEGKTYLQLKGTSNGFLASIRNGTLDDFETGYFVNFTASSVDESEAGLSTKVRFLNQAVGDPFTLSGVFTIGRTSDRFINYVRADRNAVNTAEDPFNAGRGDRGPIPPNLFGLFTERFGETLILTLSAPLQQVTENYSWWVIPKASYVQQSSRLGASDVQLAGVTVGGSLRLSKSLELMGEVTPLIQGNNILVGDRRQQTLPWSAGLRWTFDGGGGAVPGFDQTASLDLYVTNSLGLSPYQSLRAIADNGLSAGLGLNFPLQLPF
ncbi:AMIN domain-containing protein [Anthocerotibacter panamensis]|uniref:AMIN domain-containing protein n=1 Tax=Anthocerotibacter panamensis TaxID=2857077 RepID=UPI001C40307F|nr:AMIN domain-containing protein [Anthocerotibacter panamensis]